MRYIRGKTAFITNTISSCFLCLKTALTSRPWTSNRRGNVGGNFSLLLSHLGGIWLPSEHPETLVMSRFERDVLLFLAVVRQQPGDVVSWALVTWFSFQSWIPWKEIFFYLFFYFTQLNLCHRNAFIYLILYNHFNEVNPTFTIFFYSFNLDVTKGVKPAGLYCFYEHPGYLNMSSSLLEYNSSSPHNSFFTDWSCFVCFL